MTMDNLRVRQDMPLKMKIVLTRQRIREWHDKFQGNIYTSISGRDSAVLNHIVRGLYPNTRAAYVDTGLEWPEIREHIKTVENVTWLKPSIPFPKVIEKYGFPVISKEVAQKIHEIRTTKSEKLKNKRLYGDEKGNGKLPEKWQYLINAPFKISHMCCNVMKKQPVKRFERETGLAPMVGSMASESRLRETNYLKYGCNSWDTPRPMSTPLAFWKDEDIKGYVDKYNVSISKIYDMGYERTGCMFCGFGIQFQDEDGIKRFDRMKHTHPAQYNYCMNKLGLYPVFDYVGVMNKNYELDYT